MRFATRTESPRLSAVLIGRRPRNFSTPQQLTNSILHVTPFLPDDLTL